MGTDNPFSDQNYGGAGMNPIDRRLNHPDNNQFKFQHGGQQNHHPNYGSMKVMVRSDQDMSDDNSDGGNR